MDQSDFRSALVRHRKIIVAVLVICCLLAIGGWYWYWGRSRSLNERDPSGIPAEHRFAGQPPELVAVLATKSIYIGGMSIAFSPDGKRVAGGFGSGEIVLWDVGRLKEIAAWKAHALPVGRLVFTPDGKTLISGSADKTIRFWDVANREFKERTVLREPMDDPWCLALSPEGNLLVSSGLKGTIRLWDILRDPPQQKSVVDRNWHSIWSMSIASDGRTLACARPDEIQLRDLDDDKLKVKTAVDGHKGNVWRVIFAPDGKTLASCGEDKTIRLWQFDGERLRYRAALHGHATIKLYHLIFTPDGKALISADMDGRVIIWDVETRSERYRWQWPKEIGGVALAPDGRHLAISGWTKNIVYILRLPG